MTWSGPTAADGRRRTPDYFRRRPQTEHPSPRRSPRTQTDAWPRPGARHRGPVKQNKGSVMMMMMMMMMMILIGRSQRASNQESETCQPEASLCLIHSGYFVKKLQDITDIHSGDEYICLFVILFCSFHLLYLSIYNIYIYICIKNILYYILYYTYIYIYV